MMEKRKADWMAHWGRARDVKARLRHVFATPHGRKVLKWFRDKDLEPDVLAFVLIYIVWLVQDAKAGDKKALWPPTRIWKQGAQQCRQAAQWLRKHGTACQLPYTDKISDQLELYVRRLDGEYLNVRVGNVFTTIKRSYVGSRGKRDVARQQAIGVLAGYFKDLGDANLNLSEHSPWEAITNFLIVAGL